MTEPQLLKLNTALLGFIAALGFGAALALARPVILPFAVALLAAFAVEPLVRGLQRFRVPRWLGALTVVSLIFVSMGTMVAIAVGTLEQFSVRLPRYLELLQGYLEELSLPEEIAARLRVDDTSFWSQLVPVDSMVNSIGALARAGVGGLADFTLVLLITVALIIARKRVDERLRRAASSATGRGEEATRVIAAIDSGIQTYMALKTGLSVAFGISLFAVLSVFGVDFAVLWGFLGFFLNYIPTVGPALAAAPGVAILWLLHAGSTGYAVAGTVSIIAVPFLFGNLIEPKLFGDSLNLNFFAVLFALLLWGFLWGVAGAFISVPIVMAISVICREVPALRIIHELLRA
ncbi:MAG: AI-2E family transporter [Deltaproteobacteria bacterium]|nr:AI-2E family transporter [Deltaproteobacteria bacterium]MCB9789263.1 AI-2E family transporter [Deltaproteobacteria bacterium]